MRRPGRCNDCRNSFPALANGTDFKIGGKVPVALGAGQAVANLPWSGRIHDSTLSEAAGIGWPFPIRAAYPSSVSTFARGLKCREYIWQCCPVVSTRSSRPVSGDCVNELPQFVVAGAIQRHLRLIRSVIPFRQRFPGSGKRPSRTPVLT